MSLPSSAWLHLAHGALAEQMTARPSGLSAAERAYLKRRLTLRLPEGDARAEALLSRGFRVTPYRPRGVLTLAFGEGLGPQERDAGLVLSLSAHPLGVHAEIEEERGALAAELRALSSPVSQALSVARLTLLRRTPQLSLSALWVEPLSAWGEPLTLSDEAHSVRALTLKSLAREGHSAALSVALSALTLYLSASRELELVAASAALTPSGGLSPVRALQAKLVGLLESGLRPRFTFVSALQPELSALLADERLAPLNLTPARTLDEVINRTFPEALTRLDRLAHLSPLGAAREALRLEHAQEHASAQLMVTSAYSHREELDPAHRLEVEVSHEVILSTLALYRGDTHESLRRCELIAQHLTHAPPEVRCAVMSAELSAKVRLREASTLTSLFGCREALALCERLLEAPPTQRVRLEALGVKARALRLSGELSAAREALQAQLKLYLPPEERGERARCWLNLAQLEVAALTLSARPQEAQRADQALTQALSEARQLMGALEEGRRHQSYRHELLISWKAAAARLKKRHLLSPSALPPLLSPLGEVSEVSEVSEPLQSVRLLCSLREPHELMSALINALERPHAPGQINARASLALLAALVPQAALPVALLAWWRATPPLYPHEDLSRLEQTLEPLTARSEELTQALRRLHSSLSARMTAQELSEELVTLTSLSQALIKELSPSGRALCDVLTRLAGCTPQLTSFPQLIMSYHILTVRELLASPLMGDLELCAEPLWALHASQRAAWHPLSAAHEAHLRELDLRRLSAAISSFCY